MDGLSCGLLSIKFDGFHDDSVRVNWAYGGSSMYPVYRCSRNHMKTTSTCFLVLRNRSDADKIKSILSQGVTAQTLREEQRALAYMWDGGQQVEATLTGRMPD